MTAGDRLDGQVALVTGGASGIGRATAHLLAGAGAHVVIVDRNLDGANAVVSELDGEATKAMALVVDLMDAAAVPPAVASAVEAMGRIDILVNAAGVVSMDALIDVTEAEWDRVHSVNLKAPLFLMHSVARQMIARGNGGRIVNVTSSSAFRATDAPAAYASSKAALTALTRVAAAELGRHDINVNAVAPGLTDTPLVGTIGRDVLEARVREGPVANLLGRLSEPVDVASVILFLCLPSSRQITGQTVHTSAGLVV